MVSLVADIGALQIDADTALVLQTLGKCCSPFDDGAADRELVDQEALMSVLGIGQHKGIRTEAFALILQTERRHLEPNAVGARLTEMNCGSLDAGGDDGVGDAELAIEFERARLHAHCT